ncbi:hypothetical protein HDU96_003397 [Phlyctochytrium bullatum]|nr:hypothetical protein HDU96_003397 [Phlyctochytrium bullatum]
MEDGDDGEEDDGSEEVHLRVRRGLRGEMERQKKKKRFKKGQWRVLGLYSCVTIPPSPVPAHPQTTTTTTLHATATTDHHNACAGAIAPTPLAGRLVVKDVPVATTALDDDDTASELAPRVLSSVEDVVSDAVVADPAVVVGMLSVGPVKLVPSLFVTVARVAKVVCVIGARVAIAVSVIPVDTTADPTLVDAAG